VDIQTNRIHLVERKENKKPVLEKLEMKQELFKEVKTQQLKYSGHIKIHHSLLKNILEGRNLHEENNVTYGGKTSNNGLEKTDRVYKKHKR
jgi:hypothetical protein